MTLRRYLVLMSFATLLCWLAWFFVLESEDPTDATWLAFLFFYLSLFLASMGTFSVLGFAVRRLFIKSDTAVFHHVKQTFRQSFFVAFFIFGCLALSAHHWLAWWNAVVFACVLIFIEGIIFSKRKFNNGSYV